MSAANDVRRSGKEIKLSREEFNERFNQRYEDPAYDRMRAQIHELESFQKEVRNSAKALYKTLLELREGGLTSDQLDLDDPRPK